MKKKNDYKDKMKKAYEVIVGDYIMISNQPCLVTQILHSKPGKHTMKALIYGRNLFTQRKMECLQRFEEPIQLIQPQFQQLQIIDIEKDYFVSVLNKYSQIRQIKIVNLDQQRQDIMKAFEKCQEQDKKLFAKIVKVAQRQEVIGFKIE